MMAGVLRVDGREASAVEGRPVVDWPKALWNGGLAVAVALLAVPLATPGAVAMCAGFTWTTLLVGHSVGMHRMMIHRTFSAPRWLERALIWVGVLVGVAGPFGIIRVHDTRDWAQRQPACHPFFAHTRSLPRDLWWQLTHRFAFDRPPELTIEPRLADDPVILWLERTWRWQQLPLALVLYAIGGWGWVVWGVAVRVLVSTVGHWTITWFCHNPGPGRWRVAGAAVQASDRPGLGWITYGECWHNNHHAFPESARIGLEAGQADPGWWLIAALERAGLIRNVGRPRPAIARDDLTLAHMEPS